MELSETLLRNRDQIIRRWLSMLHRDVSSAYSNQSLKDLEQTITAATDANFRAIVHNDFKDLDAVIQWIGRIRSRARFTLSEVQKAFELYRTILLPILAREPGAGNLITAMDRVNRCLGYTLQQFSEYYQALHEAEIRAYSQSLEIKVKERTRQLAESESLARIGRVTTSLAHEIRNPLSSAKMSIQMILKNEVYEGTDRRRLEILSQQIVRLEHIVTEILDSARPMQFNFVPGDVAAALDDCLEVLDARIHEKGIIITRSFSKTLPSISMDREKIEQTFVNLLQNAIEAVEEGGRIHLTARYDPKSKTVRIVIADNGCGVSPEDLPSLFDPFFSKKARGTGLGLANARRIVEAHHGEIHGVPEKKRGMRFVVTLPSRRISGRDHHRRP